MTQTTTNRGRERLHQVIVEALTAYLNVPGSDTWSRVATLAVDGIDRAGLVIFEPKESHLELMMGLQ